jgi:hypothetical protein
MKIQIIVYDLLLMGDVETIKIMCESPGVYRSSGDLWILNVIA